MVAVKNILLCTIRVAGHQYVFNNILNLLHLNCVGPHRSRRTGRINFHIFGNIIFDLIINLVEQFCTISDTATLEALANGPTNLVRFIIGV